MMNKENILMVTTCVICLAGCAFLSVFNMWEANYQYAEIIPSTEYNLSQTASHPSDDGADKGSAATPESTVNINTASAEELEAVLPGIGIVKARRIVEYRALIGSYDSVDQLINVDGIGEKTLEKIRPYCRTND